jgi:YesN/AraC family two-component response regulator
MWAANPRCIIVILTGYPPLNSSIEKIHHNVDEYITKPANAEASLAILADRLGVRKQEDGKELIKLAGRADTWAMTCDDIASQRCFMPPKITAKYLGDKQAEKQIRERLNRELRDYAGDWRISVLGVTGSDRWQIEVEDSADERKYRVTKILAANQTVDKIVQETTRMIETAQKQKSA